MATAYDHKTLQDMALVQQRLLRDMRNAKHAVQHGAQPLDDYAFTLALFSAAAEFSLDQVEPEADVAKSIPLLAAVFRGELFKVGMARATDGIRAVLKAVQAREAAP